MATPFKYLQPVETQFVPRYASPNTQLLATSAQAVEQQYQTAKKNYDTLDLTFDNVREQIAGMPAEAQKFVEGYIQNSKEQIDSLIESGGYRDSMAAITSMAKKVNKDITPLIQDSEKFKLGIQAINESNADAFGKNVLTNLAQTRLFYNPETKRLTGVDTKEFTNIANSWVNLSDYFQDYLSSMEETAYGGDGQVALKGLSPNRAFTGLLQKIEADENISRQLALETEYYVENQPSFFPEEVQNMIEEYGDDALNKTFQVEGYDKRMSLMEYVAFKKANPGFTAEVTSDYVEDKTTGTGSGYRGGLTPLGVTSLANRSLTLIDDDSSLYEVSRNAREYIEKKVATVEEIDKSLIYYDNLITDYLGNIDENLLNSGAIKKDDTTGFLSINTDVISEEEAFGRSRELISAINTYNEFIARKKRVEADFSYLHDLGASSILSYESLLNIYKNSVVDLENIEDVFETNRGRPFGRIEGPWSKKGPGQLDQNFVDAVTNSENISIEDGKVSVSDSVLEAYLDTENEDSIKSLVSLYTEQLQKKYDEAITKKIKEIQEQDIRYEAETFLIPKNTQDPIYNYLVDSYSNQSVLSLVEQAMATSGVGSRVIVGNEDIDLGESIHPSRLLDKNGVKDVFDIQPSAAFKFAYDEEGKPFLIFNASSPDRTIQVHLFGEEAANIVQEYTNNNPEITHQVRSMLFGSLSEISNKNQEVEFDEGYLRTALGVRNIKRFNIRKGKLPLTGITNYVGMLEIINPDGSTKLIEIKGTRDQVYDQFLQIASQ